MNDPACRDDARFTSESAEEDGALTKVCARCPVREQCRDWALAAPKYQRYGFFAGVSRRGQSRPRGSRAPAITPDQIERIADGLSVQAIADEMDRTVTTVQRHLRRLALAD